MCSKSRRPKQAGICAAHKSGFVVRMDSWGRLSGLAPTNLFREIPSMEVRLFVLAKYAEFQLDGSVNLMSGDLTNVQVAELPFWFPSLMIVTKLLLTREEALEVHSVRFDLLAPD